MPRRICLLLLLLLTVLNLQAETFRFKYTAGDKYKMVTQVRQDVYLNGRYDNSAESLYKISVAITEVNGETGHVLGKYFITDNRVGNLGLYSLVENQYTSDFWRDARGLYTIDPMYFYPAVRNIPIFPIDSINIGDSWRETAMEVQDQRDAGIQEPVPIPIEVYYTYLKNDVIDNTQVAVFSIEYTNIVNFDELPGPGKLSVIRVYAKVKQVYNWDIQKGRPYSYQEDFDFTFFYSTGQRIRFLGKSEGYVIQTEEMDEQALTDEIGKQLEDLDDVTVRPEDDGVVITLENIRFMPDSAELMPGELKKLDRIAGILSQYPGRDLLITGHTAYAGIDYGLQELSEQRAAAVAQYLLRLGVRDKTQVMIQGKGPDEPVGDNNTEVGRQKNRRVEIKILEN